MSAESNSYGVRCGRCGNWVTACECPPTSRIPQEAIGYLIREAKGYTVACLQCAASGAMNTGAVIWYSTVFPYNQDCGVCGKQLVKGFKTWPQLFEGN